jgi:hypothetical protein
MKIHIVSNGVTSIVLTPESDLEKHQLSEIVKGEIQLKMYPKMQLIDKELSDSVVITSKQL